MRIVVTGGHGRVGAPIVARLTADGHRVSSASRRSGADVYTGDGLAGAFDGAEVLVDAAASPWFDDDGVMRFFTAAAGNQLAAARVAGIGHYVLLSIVGADGLPESGYMRAKVAGERIIVEGGLPYTIVRATQFHEFVDDIVASLTVGDEVRVPDARIQPIAVADVADEVARVVAGAPVNGLVNVGGPEKLSFAELATALLTHRGAQRSVVVDPTARYFGSPLGPDSLVAAAGAATGTTRFADWLATH